MYFRDLFHFCSKEVEYVALLIKIKAVKLLFCSSKTMDYEIPFHVIKTMVLLCTMHGLQFLRPK